jgi:hypothetical protein
MKKVFPWLIIALLSGCGKPDPEMEKARAALEQQVAEIRQPEAKKKEQKALVEQKKIAEGREKHQAEAKATEAVKQEQRQELMQKLLDNHVFVKIEYGKGGKIYVDHAFYALTFDEKQSAVNLVHTYEKSADPTISRTTLFDGYSGKEIGAFREGFGLEMN